MGAGSARSASASGGAPFSAAGMSKSQRNKARLKRRKAEERGGMAPGALSGSAVQSSSTKSSGSRPAFNTGAKKNKEIRMHVENRDVAAAFRSLEALLRRRMLLQDTTVAMLITLCLKVARQPEQIQQLTQAMRFSGTPLDIYSLLAGLSSISQLCAAGTDAPAEQSVDAIIQALFGTSGLAQLVQFSQTVPSAGASCDAARTHVLHQSKLLVMEFLGAAVSEFDRIANKSMADLVQRRLALGPNLIIEHVSPDGSTVKVRAPSPFNKGDAVLLSGRRTDPSDPGLEQIEQIEGEVSSANPLTVALREPFPDCRRSTVSYHVVSVVCA
eukprot:COSAG02_NODE_1060_length_14866_cov_3.131916_11_plen_328_part_00